MKAEIRKVIVGCHRNETDRLIYELGRAGIVHVADWDRQEAPGGDIDREKSAASTLHLIEYLAPIVGAGADNTDGVPGVAVLFDRDTARDASFLKSVREQADELNRLHQEHDARAEALNSRHRAAADAALLFKDLDAGTPLDHFDIIFGTLRETPDPEDGDLAGRFYVRHAGRLVLGVAASGKRDELLGALYKYGFEEMRKPDDETASFQGLAESAREEMASAAAALRAREKAFNEKKEEYARAIGELRGIYRALSSALEAKRRLMNTEDTVFMSGWIDAGETVRLAGILDEVCGRGCYAHVYSRAEMRNIRAPVPVRLRNNRFFRAFEMLVKNAGVPDSLEIDPTPIATIAYLIMFGVMFGDVGQGMVLAVAGVVIKEVSRRRGLRGFFPDAGTILIAGGISASIFGALYGSVFSSEHIIPALWFHPMERMMDLFFAAIMMGASFISIGIVINTLNLYREGDYREAFLGLKGVPGFVMYTGSLYLVVRYVKAGVLPGTMELALFLGLPAGLFLARNVAGRLFPGQGEMFPHGVFEYIVESVVELMDFFSGLLGNSISFIRAGAFALSHAGLSLAVYTLAGVVGPLLSPGSLAVIVIGNLFIIALEGLVCGIQSMRLEYYEFFGKFYKGSGTEFRPFSLHITSTYTGGT